MQYEVVFYLYWVVEYDWMVIQLGYGVGGIGLDFQFEVDVVEQYIYGYVGGFVDDNVQCVVVVVFVEIDYGVVEDWVQYGWYGDQEMIGQVQFQWGMDFVSGIVVFGLVVGIGGGSVVGRSVGMEWVESVKGIYGFVEIFG